MSIRTKKEQISSWRATLLAIAMITFGFGFLSWLALKPAKDGSDIAVVLSPSVTLTEAVQTLSTLPFKFVRTGFTDFIVILRPAENADLSLLDDAGALFVINAVASGGCAFLANSDVKKKA